MQFPPNKSHYHLMGRELLIYLYFCYRTVLNLIANVNSARVDLSKSGFFFIVGEKQELVRDEASDVFHFYPLNHYPNCFAIFLQVLIV